MVEEMNRRKREILKAIIREHILKAEPIGSRTLAKTYEFGVSPATIRNEMSDLEELGYLKQPYTSAGRIPSDKGYRFYVDSLIDSEFYLNSGYQVLLDNFNYKVEGIQTIMSGMAKMLSGLTRYTAMISEPQLQKSKVKQIQLMLITKKSLLIILITDTGIVHNKIVKLRQLINSKQINYLNEFLSIYLKEKELVDINNDMMQELELELLKKINLSQGIFNIIYNELKKIVEPSEKFKIHLEGASYILEQPEFNNLETLKMVLNIFDHEEILRDLFRNNLNSNKGIEVMIGQENEIQGMQNCSIVFATYFINKKAVGKIGVMGPTRMNYSQVISVVNSIADLLGKIISETSG